MGKRCLVILLGCVMLLMSGCGILADNRNTEKESKDFAGTDSESQNESEEKNFVYEQPEMKGELTIATMYEQEFLTEAVENFREKYPNVKITVNTYQGNGGENAVEEYRTSLNTKIMSKTAEDIIFTTQIPLKKYMDMGVFMDLKQYIAATPEMNDENYFKNVLEAAEDMEEHVYVVPYMASFQTVNFDGTLLSENMREKVGEHISHSEAVNIAKQMVNSNSRKNLYLFRGNELAYMDQLVIEYQNSLIDMETGNVNINAKEYIGWLNDAKKYMEAGYFQKDSLNHYNTDYCYALANDYDVQAAYYLLANKNEQNVGVPLADANGNVYTSSAYCMGINSESKNKEVAWEFIKYLLSDEVQTLPSIHGLAVNKTGFSASVERYLAFYQDTETVSLEEYNELLTQWMEKVSKCDTLDPSILNFFDEENKKFFDGVQSAEQTAQTIQNKVTQYLNE